MTPQPTMDPATAESKENAGLLPVTLLSGFLGAGKTTLLKQILRNKQGLKIALIVNDMGSINMDANEVKKHKLIQEKTEMVELQNGCICCTLRGDLLRTVKELAETKEFDYLVIESTGIAEPLPVAQTFVMDVNGGGFMEEQPADADADANTAADADADVDEKTTTAEFEPLLKYARMDTLVTVLDSFNFLPILGSVDTEATRKQFLGDEEPEEDEATLVQLLVDQIEFANVIILNKIDLLEKEYCTEKSGETVDSILSKIRTLVAKLNPRAKVVVPSKPFFESFDVTQVLNTNMFDMEEAQVSAGWLHELAKPAHTPETEEYGISSLVFRTRERPFHSQRLADILNGFGSMDLGRAADDQDVEMDDANAPFAGVVRCKGQLWLANADSCRIDLHSVGKQVQLSPSDPWIGKVVDVYPYGDADSQPPADFDAETLRMHREAWEYLELSQAVIDEYKTDGEWSDKFGDRHSEVVFIGVNLDKDLLRKSLEDALMNDAEMEAGQEAWAKIEDPFFGTLNGEMNELDLHAEEEMDEEMDEDEDIENVENEE